MLKDCWTTIKVHVNFCECDFRFLISWHCVLDLKKKSLHFMYYPRAAVSELVSGWEVGGWWVSGETVSEWWEVSKW